jgi:hypothetical protein
MWILGLWPRNSFSGIICFEFSALVLCSVTHMRHIHMGIIGTLDFSLFSISGWSLVLLVSFLSFLEEVRSLTPRVTRFLVCGSQDAGPRWSCTSSSVFLKVHSSDLHPWRNRETKAKVVVPLYGSETDVQMRGGGGGEGNYPPQPGGYKEMSSIFADQ